MTALWIYVLVVTLAMTSVIYENMETVLHADESLHIITALNLEPYLPAGDAWPIKSYAQTMPAGAFVTTWDVIASPHTVKIPVNVHAGGELVIDWGDGSASTTVTVNGIQEHTYSDPDQYQISMTGDLSRIIMGDINVTPSKLISIDQWGDIKWSSMENAFALTNNMEYKASDAPDLSEVSSMNGMFDFASNFDGDLSSWNVSTITDMRDAFNQADSFNGNISSWNISGVTNMHSMFLGADAFNQPLNGWDVSSVTGTNYMFSLASSFNQTLNGWDVSSVTDMSHMFRGASSFNQPLNNWDTSSVINMHRMFASTPFNGDISDWDVSEVIFMSQMFYDAIAFDGDISDWDVSSVTNMDYTFGSAGSFNQSLSNWDTSSVTNMEGMFHNAGSFNQSLSNWDTSSVTNMEGMFHNAGSFNQHINNWNVSSVINMRDMFHSASSFNQPLSNWDVSSAFDMDSMFDNADSFEQNLGTWYIVPDDTVYDVSNETSLIVTSIAAQNRGLDSHTPQYDIGSGGNSKRFKMLGNTLQFKNTPIQTKIYTVNVTAPGGDFGTDNHCVINVTVISDTDNGDGSGTDNRCIINTPTDNLNSPPDVDAGDDRSFPEGSTVTLDGTVTDADAEDDLDYTWTHNSADLTITFVNEKAVDTTFDAPNVSENTDVVFTLAVFDGTVTVSDSVTITITDSANSPPDVDAGDDRSFPEGSTVTLDGTVTDADAEDDLDYTWTHNSADLTITFVNEKAVDTTFDAPNVSENTDVVFTLAVFDGTVTVSDSVTITITDSANSPPSVDAGDNRSFPEGSTVTLDGTVTDADAEDDLDYTWTHNSADLTITFVNEKAVDTTFDAPNVSENTDVVFTLAVFDGTVTVSDSVTITITDSANSPPSVDAGDNRSFPEGSTVTLDGTVTDADAEDDLDYTWTHNSADLTITFVNEKAVDTTFDAPNVSENTDVEFTLAVFDGTVTVSDSVTITITDSANSPPSVDAGDNRSFPEGSTVTLDGTVTDADAEDDLDYTWTHNSADLTITFVNEKAVDTTFDAPNVSENTDVVFTLAVFDGTVTVSDSVTITITDSANSPPSVDAGDDRSFPEGSTVTLDGTVTDADAEDDLDYTWTHNSADLTITFVNEKAVDTTFDAPNVSENTDVEFTLAVFDGTVTVSDSVTITITDSANSPPSVDAGDNRSFPEGSTVTLDGTVTDADAEDDLDYTWTHNSADLTITFVNEKAVDTTFDAPNVSENTDVEFTLAVFDGTVTVSDSVTITITDSANSPPSVDAGDNRSFPEGSTVTLDGTVTDADAEDDLDYTWTHNSADLTITFVNEKAVDTTFDAPNVSENTDVVFTLAVFDGTVTVSDSVTITITDSANSPPSVDAGDDRSFPEGSTVTLDGTVTDADAEDDLDYTWTHNSADLTITFVNEKAVDTTFDAPNVSENTDVEFTLAVFDGTVTVSDSVTITITDSANSPPDVDAGDDRSFPEGSTVTLDGTVTDADAEDDLDYTWTHNSADLTITFVNEKAVDTTFDAPNVSENTDVEFTLAVFDGTVTVSDSVTITITDSANSPPSVDAGDDRSFPEGSTVTLDGTVTDADAEDDLDYTWTHNSADLTITFVNEKAVDTTFDAPNVSENTDVEFTLAVFDGTVTVSDSVTITITDSANSPPSVDAGDNRSFPEGSTVTLDGTVTDADAEDDLDYTWTHNSADLTITFVNEKAVDTTFDAPNVSENTDVEFTLAVFDGTVTVSDSVTITITDSANSPPSVDAGDDRSFPEGSTVTLDGTVTDADAEDDLDYTWTHNSADLTITFVNEKAVDTTFDAPNVSENTDVEFTLAVFDGTVTVSDSVTITITDSANSPPSVDAGDNRSFPEGSTVTLDGTVTDADAEDDLDYTWTHNSADLTITFVNEKAVDTTFDAPNVSENTDVEFTLAVFDGTVTVSDSVTITITDSANSPPSVDAGDDRSFPEGSTVTLDGTVTDADAEDDLDYTWTHNSADLTITFVNEKAVDTTFDAPNVSENTDVEFTLAVFDGTVTVSDSVTITITDSANSPPSVDAGDDRSFPEGSTVTLDGTVTDADAEDDLDYTWTHNSADLTITFVNEKAVDTTFDAPNVSENTDVVFTLAVFDGTVTVSDSVTITITDSANSPPSVDAGDDRSFPEGSTVTLDGTVTDADAEDDLDYTWTHNSADLTITFVNEKAVDTTFDAPNVSENTDVEFTLAVFDGTVTVSDSVTITITDSANSPPSVDAGDDRSFPEGSTVTLDGTVTDADAEDDLDYTWTHNSADLTITFVNEKAVDTTFDAPNVSENTDVEFTLAVFDGTVTVSDSVTITITDSANSPPSVDAGNDQTVVEGSTVSLDGTVTGADPEDDLTYLWSHNSPLDITFANDQLGIVFNAPYVSEQTDVVFTLAVFDGTVTVSDTVVVTITDSANSPPSVDAGDDRSFPEGSTVTLDGTVTDADAEDDLDYTWSHSSTLAISITNDSDVDATFDAPNVSENTDVEFTLAVFDGTVTVSDSVTITITDSANSPPSVDAGDDRSFPEGSTVTLDGTVTDADAEDDLDYTWSHSSTLAISITNDSDVDATFDAPNVSENTDVEFTLAVFDGTVTVSDSVTITITDSANSPPSVDAGDDRSFPEGSTVTLDGTVTDADAEDDLDYTWSHSSTLAISITNDSDVDATFDAPNVSENTDVEFTLAVFDGTVTVSDSVTITITDSANSPPDVDAGDDRSFPEGSTVTLDGTVTDTDHEDELDYTWTHNSANLTIAFTDNKAIDTTFTAPNVSGDIVIVFTLTVNDGTVTISDMVEITITDEDMVTMPGGQNSPPNVDAGGDQTVDEGAVVTLDGSDSYDPDGNSIEHSWVQISGPEVTLLNSDTDIAYFDAPRIPDNLELMFELTVSDVTVSDSARITVTVIDNLNDPPILAAIGAQDRDEFGIVSFNATATDVDGNDLVFLLEGIIPRGASITRDGSFTWMPDRSQDGTFMLNVTVSDGDGGTDYEIVPVTAHDMPPYPISATAFQSYSILLVLSEAVTYEGSGPNGFSVITQDGNPVQVESITGNGTTTLRLGLNGTISESDTVKLGYSENAGDVVDLTGNPLATFSDLDVFFTSSRSRGSPSPPAIVVESPGYPDFQIPQWVIDAAGLEIPHDAQSVITPISVDDTFDFPLEIDGQGYLLRNAYSTMVPHTVTVDSSAQITFTVYANKEIMHFILYLNMSGQDTDYHDSDTYVVYDGRTHVTDPHGYLSSAVVVVTDNFEGELPKKRAVNTTLEFAAPMGITNMAVYTWDTDRRSTVVNMIDALDVVVAAPAIDADPEPTVPGSHLPADPEPTVPGSRLPADPEPTVDDPLLSNSDNDENAQTLHLIRTWSGFEPESITDAQLLHMLGFTDYTKIDLPSWMMTDLGVLVSNGAVTVDEFMTAMTYVLENF